MEQAGFTESKKREWSLRRVMERIFRSSWLYRAVRFGVSLLFLYGGIVKLPDPKAFARTISAYQLVPEPFLPVVAVGLPLGEVCAGLALFFDIRGGLAIVSGLLGLFAAVLGYGVLRELDVDCGCFGAANLARHDALRRAFIRDLVLIGFVVPFLYFSRRLRGYRPVALREMWMKINSRR